MRTTTELLVVTLLIAAQQTGAAQEKDKRYPKLAPYSAIRWKDSTPEVEINDAWYELLALNDVEAKDIVKFCKEKEERLWQKRFEEDLVEMMARMGQEPGDKVTLNVRDLKTGKTETVKDVPNTHANRQAIWEARHEKK
jgi:hypothetical protein